jgi:DNA repair exonuclease SbcCD ATPase subunit
MELVHILLRNFRRFSLFETDFSSGLNVVEGPNEAGKSTLQEAIVLGLLDRPTGKKSERDYQTWGGERLYEIELTYRLPSGGMYTIHKDFEVGLHEVIDPEGRDVSRTGLEKAVELALGTSSEKLFTSTACIRQDEMVDLGRGKDELSERLQRIVMGDVVGVDDVIQRVTGKIAEYERGWKTSAPKNPGPVQRLKSQIQEIDGKIQRAREEVEKRGKAKDELLQYRERLAILDQELQSLQELLALHTRRHQLEQDLKIRCDAEQELDEKLSKVRKIEDQKGMILDKLDAFKTFTGIDEDVEGALRQAKDESGKRHAEVEDRKERVIELERRIEAEPEMDKWFSWIPGGVLVLVAALALLYLLTGQRIATSYHLPLVVVSILLGLTGALWLLVRVTGKYRGGQNLRIQLHEARERQARGLHDLKEADVRLNCLLEPFGVQTWEAFEDSLNEYKSITAEMTAVEKILSTLLGIGESQQDLEEQRKHASRDRRDIQEELAELENTPVLSPIELHKLKGEIEVLERDHRERQERIPKLEALNEMDGATIEDLYRLEEQRADLERHLDLAMERHYILGLTLDGLRQAREQTLHRAQEELGLRLGEYLQRLTRGRYKKAFIDENLHVGVAGDSRGQKPISVEELSTGTRDQVYLAARLALSDMIFQDARPPMLMDDPFVKFDPKRREAALELCKELAVDRQIILFTCHDGYSPYADRVIRLE